MVSGMENILSTPNSPGTKFNIRDILPRKERKDKHIFTYMHYIHSNSIKKKEYTNVFLYLEIYILFHEEAVCSGSHDRDPFSTFFRCL